MPRAKVPPGSESNLSSSSASRWRGANLSCWATSARASPRDVRAWTSASPTPHATPSVKVASLQRLVLGRAGEVAAQLAGVARFRKAIAHLALDAQGEPHRLGRRPYELVVVGDEPSCLVHAALPVADGAHLQERRRIFRLQLQRALKQVFRLDQIVGPQRALARGRVGAPRRRIKRIADRLQEVLDRGLLTARLAKEPAVVVVD